MSKEIIPIERIARAIYLLHGQKVLLDFDLAALYGVSTKALNQAVKRNRERFPADFMFHLSIEETRSLRSQFVTLCEQTAQTEGAAKNRSQFVTGSLKHRERKSRPYAFTEQGVAMLSSVDWGAHASRVWVSVSRRNGLPVSPFPSSNDIQSLQWRDTIASTRDACAPRR